MRKSKLKFSNFVMIAMILIAIIFIYVDKKNIRLTADELSSELLTDFEVANKKYLDKKLELYGKVKSYYSFQDKPNLLELETGNSKVKIFCSFLSSKDDSVAATLTYAAPVILSGTFQGNKNQDSPENIYIEASNISIAQD